MIPLLHEVGQSLGLIRPFVNLCQLLPPDKFYLVGGALRNALLGKPVSDIDLASSCDPTQIAKEFASSNGGHWFWLDESRLQSRVVFKTPMLLTFDFAPFRAEDLIQDLAARDFTINSMALSLPDKLENSQIIDPLNGIFDLKKQTLKMSGPVTFSSDPLRILKGVRHAVELNFKLDQPTSLSMARNAWKLRHMAVERIRQEVWSILQSPFPAYGIKLLFSQGVGGQLWGNDFDTQHAVLLEKLEQCHLSWEAFRKMAPITKVWLEQEVQQGLTRQGLLLFTLCFALIKPGFPISLSEDWRVSRNAQRRITSLSMTLPGMSMSLDAVAPNLRAFYFWLQKHGLDPADSLLAASVTTRKGRHCLIEKLLKWVPLVSEVVRKNINDLVTGEWISRELDIVPGPDVGKALAVLRNAEIEGLVANSHQAKSFLRAHYKE
ncbi:MAG: CCA tRNA nucleotidyltransferase [Deltaproteobacteria bacterium]|jgi:poly(A) polymerase|nr:CCA tRNA nucleotidyltransferase [Deltaproteobacteria bacterium]